MKVFNEETNKSQGPTTFVLLLDKKEARTLVEMAEAAVAANKRRGTFKAINKKLAEFLCCY